MVDGGSGQMLLKAPMPGKRQYICNRGSAWNKPSDVITIKIETDAPKSKLAEEMVPGIAQNLEVDIYQQQEFQVGLSVKVFGDCC